MQSHEELKKILIAKLEQGIQTLNKNEQAQDSASNISVA